MPHQIDLRTHRNNLRTTPFRSRCLCAALLNRTGASTAAPPRTLMSTGSTAQPHPGIGASS
jgi:hypothetical protein